MKLCPICKQVHNIDAPCPPTVSMVKSSDDPLVGRVLDGKYALEYLISRGGMASVYSARRRQIGDLVAVKILKLDDDCDPVDLKRFQLEAATAASIKHPNIVAIHDFGLLDDIAYLVMERLEGPPLSKDIRLNGNISIERSIRIFRQVCAAVSAAHKLGVVHRDLKPSNIIFQGAKCEDDLVKVVDFGIAKLLSAPKGSEKLTSAEFALGTPEYISPEQCLGHKLDERSDIYSLGIVLYEMLSGEVPFYNPVPSAILVQHAIETPKPLMLVNPAIPKLVNDVVMKALEKNRENRFRSAIEMATEFELACRNASIELKQLANPNENKPNLGNNNRQKTVKLQNNRPVAPMSFSTAIARPSTPTEGIKAATGARTPVRFSFERFIGRNDELKQLEEHFEQVKQGQARITFIIGDAGVGKTELVRHFQQQLGLAAGLVIVGRFYEFGSAAPYRPYLDGLYSLTRNFPERNGGQWPKPHVEGLTTKIRQGLDEVDLLINAELQKGGEVEEENKYRTFELLTRIFVSISALTPIILFLDDLHWADSLSLEFLVYLMRNHENNRILAICTARGQELLNEHRPIKPWMRRISRYNGYAQIKISPMTDIEVRMLIDSIFTNIKISESLLRRLHEVTQGNPFYIGEIIRQLIQDQKIFWTGDRWQCAELEEIDLPESILDLVELHLRRLTDETIDVFTRAAVVGEKFSFQLLRSITDLSKEALMDVLDIGLREFIIKESITTEPFADDYFVFYHSTLRKVLYERLSSYRRRRLHAQIGEKLVNLNPRKLDRVAGELAYHFYHGDNFLQTLKYSFAAGESTRNIFAIEEAYRYYTWADESLQKLLDSGEENEYSPEWLVNFRLAYGNIMMHLGRNDQARQQLDIGLELSQQHDLKSQQGKLLRALGELCWSRGLYQEALNYCQHGLKILETLSEPGDCCRLYDVIGNTYFSQGNFSQSIESYQQSLELARQAKEMSYEGEALRHIGSILGWHGQSQEALKNLTEALSIARVVNNRESERQVLMALGNINYELGDLSKAATYYLQSLHIARAIGRRRGECRIAVNMGEIYRLQGDLVDAKNFFIEANEIALEIQDREIQGHTLTNLGLVHQDLGENDQALDYFHQALTVFGEIRYRSNVEAETLAGIANIYLEKKQIDDAKIYFEKALLSGQELGRWQLVIPNLRGLATCERAQARPVTAKLYLEQVLEIINKQTINNELSNELSQDQQQYQSIKAEVLKEIAELEQDINV